MLLLIAVVLVLMNTYSLIASRNLIFNSKESSIQSQASVIATSLAGLDKLTMDGIGQVLRLIDTDQFTTVAVSDQYGNILYDSSDSDYRVDPATISGAISQALPGYDVFHSEFKDGAFVSYATTPIMRADKLKGALFVYEYDDEQGGIITALRSNLRNFSIIIAILTAAMILIFIKFIMDRASKILDAIKSVREGEYNYRIEVKGNDELAMLSDEVNSLTARLQKTEDTRRRFISDASHELKTPLASIRLLTDSILQNDNMDSETVHDFVSGIGEEAERLSRITEKLLNLTKLDNKVRTKPVEVDVGNIVKNVTKMLTPLADSRDISITYNVDDNCVVLATNDDLHQIIFNIVENAIKYNVTGGKVFINAAVGESDIEISIEDTGIGIPEEDLPNIFDRFYRVDKARSREAGGSGLGLSIVKDAAKEHNGTVEAFRREEGGMRFVVRFPKYLESK